AEVLLTVLSLPLEFAWPEGAEVTELVDHIHRGPHGVAPGVPVLVFAVDDDREQELLVARLATDAGGFALAVGLGRVDADQDDIFVFEAFIPFLVPGIVVNAVDAVACVEMDHHDLSAELLELKWG